MSRRPSPSRSPVVTPFQRPTQRSSPHSTLASRRRPWSFRNSLSDPHSGARIRSGQPSPFTSEKTAAEMRPTRSNSLVLASSSTSRPPPSLRKSRDDAASGYVPGATRPPTNRSRSPSPSTSATASGPTLATSPGITGVVDPAPGTTASTDRTAAAPAGAGDSSFQRPTSSPLPPLRPGRGTTVDSSYP